MFPSREAHHGKPLDPSEIALFEAPGQPCPGGGITRVCKEEWAANRHGESRKGVVLYLYVQDIKSWEEVSDFRYSPNATMSLNNGPENCCQWR